jgi:hypothetical protein
MIGVILLTTVYFFFTTKDHKVHTKAHKVLLNFISPCLLVPISPLLPSYSFLLGSTILKLVPVVPLAGSSFDSALICPLCIFTIP